MTSAPPVDTGDFAWRDGERIVVFRGGALAAAPDLLDQHGWQKFDLLTTRRALAEAPQRLESVGAVHEVPAGGVAEVAAGLVNVVRTDLVVALGGGRVIDTAKAIAAAHGGRVCAIPTTLSGAEMTRIHRLPSGHEGRALIRPALVIADPEVMTSQSEAALRASAMNSLAHGAEALYTPFANPVATMSALRGAALMAAALDGPPARRDRRALALGSMLCAYALDSALFAVHHVLCQTLVRLLALPHAETNAAMLPHTLAAMRPRAPEAIARLADALGADAAAIEDRVVTLAGGTRRLSELGAERQNLDAVLDAALARPELQFTPDPPERDELARIIENAW